MSPPDSLILCISVGHTSAGGAGQGPREGGLLGAEEEGGAGAEGFHLWGGQVHQPGPEEGGEEGGVGARTRIGVRSGGSVGGEEEEKSGLWVQRLQRMVNTLLNDRGIECVNGSSGSDRLTDRPDRMNERFN